MNTESFVLYESVYKQFKRLYDRGRVEDATEFINAIMEFGLYGVMPEEESDVWLFGFEQSATSIGAAKKRYNAAVENGKKGGRPTINLVEDEVMEKKKELRTWKAVADYYGVTEQTLMNKRKEWEKNQKNPKNLNDNVNVNVNDNKNENEKEKIVSFPSGKEMHLALEEEEELTYEELQELEVSERVEEMQKMDVMELLMLGVDKEALYAAETPEARAQILGF